MERKQIEKEELSRIELMQETFTSENLYSFEAWIYHQDILPEFFHLDFTTVQENPKYGKIGEKNSYEIHMKKSLIKDQYRNFKTIHPVLYFGFTLETLSKEIITLLTNQYLSNKVKVVSYSQPIFFKEYSRQQASGIAFYRQMKKAIQSSAFKQVECIDIASFYENIPTHLFDGKYFSPKISQILKGKTKYIDKLFTYCNSKSSKGIPTGPIYSCLYSELILSFIDEEISIGIPDDTAVQIYRFVDGYYILSDGETHVKDLIIKTLATFQLQINEAKSAIFKPKDFDANWQVEFKTITDSDEKIYEKHKKILKLAIDKNKENIVAKYYNNLELNEIFTIDDVKRLFLPYTEKNEPGVSKEINSNNRITTVLFIKVFVHIYNTKPNSFLEDYINFIVDKILNRNYTVCSNIIFWVGYIAKILEYKDIISKIVTQLKNLQNTEVKGTKYLIQDFINYLESNQSNNSKFHNQIENLITPIGEIDTEKKDIIISKIEDIFSVTFDFSP